MRCHSPLRLARRADKSPSRFLANIFGDDCGTAVSGTGQIDDVGVSVLNESLEMCRDKAEAGNGPAAGLKRSTRSGSPSN
jgi:hypothetical protein